MENNFTLLFNECNIIGVLEIRRCKVITSIPNKVVNLIPVSFDIRKY